MGNNPSGSREVAGKKDFQEWPIDRVKLAFRRAQHLLVPMLEPAHEDRVTTTHPEPSSSASKLADDDNAGSSSTLHSEHSAEGTHAGSTAPNGSVHVASGGTDVGAHEQALSRVDTFHIALKAVTRRQFWEIFTDYDMVKSTTSTGTTPRQSELHTRGARSRMAKRTSSFLNLDIAMFDLFTGAYGYGRKGLEKAREASMDIQVKSRDVRYEDEAKTEVVDRVATVNGYEIFIVLAVFCKGEVDDQLSFVFELFDTDKSKEMDQDEMLALLRDLTSACWKVGLTKRPPDDDELQKLTTNMFAVADVDNDASITVHEFRKWARGHMSSQRLITAFKKQKGGRSGFMLKPLNPGSGVSAATIARRNRLQHSKIAKVASQTLVDKLSRTTKFDANELRRLRHVFSQVCGDSGEFTREQFVRVMVIEYPALRDSSMVGKAPSALRALSDAQLLAENPQLCMLFDAFDEDLSGTVDFAEFSMGLSKLTRGSAADKMAMLFEAYDADGDGTVSLAEVMKFVMKANDEMYETAEFATELLSSMDRDMSGTLTRAEFVTALKEEPLLAECFFGSLIPTKTRVLLESSHFQQDVQQAQMQNPKLNVDFLRRVWDRCVDRGQTTKSMDRVAFRKFMMEEFQCGSEVMPVVNHLFRAMDLDASGAVDFRELFTALGQVVMGSQEDKAKFYFSLYDEDKSGDVSMQEIVTLMTASKDKAGAGIQHVTDVLTKLSDANGGSISLEQFEEACREDPAMLEVFGQIFGTDSITSTLQGPRKQAATPSSQRRRVFASGKSRQEYEAIKSSLRGDRIMTSAVRKLRKQRRAVDAFQSLVADPGAAKRSLFKERLALAEAKQKANSRTEHGLEKLRKRSLEFGSKVVEALQEELVIQAAEAKERANEGVPEPPVQAPSLGATRAHRGSVAYYPGALSLAVKTHGTGLKTHFKKSYRDVKAAIGEQRDFEAAQRRRDRAAAFKAKLRRMNQRKGMGRPQSQQRLRSSQSQRQGVTAGASKGTRTRGLTRTHTWASMPNVVSVTSVTNLNNLDTLAFTAGAQASPPRENTTQGGVARTKLPARSIARIGSQRSSLKRAATAHAGMASRCRSTSRLHSPSTSERPLSRQSRSFRARAKPDLAVDITDVPPMVPPGSKAGLAALKRKKSMRASREAARVERAAMEQRYGHKAGHSVASAAADSVFVVHPNGDTTYLRSPSSHAGNSPAAVGTVRDDVWGDDDVLGPTVEATVPSPGAFRASTTGNELNGAAHTGHRHHGPHDSSEASEPVPLAANVSMERQPVLVPSPVVTKFHPPRDGSTFPAAMSPWSASSRGTRSPTGGRSPVVSDFHGNGGWGDAVPHPTSASPCERASWFTLQGHMVAPGDEDLRSPHSRAGTLPDTRASAVRQSSPMVVPGDAAQYRRKTPGSSPVAVPAVVGASVSPPAGTHGVSMLRSPLSMSSPERPQSANPSNSGGVRATALARPRTAGAGTSCGGLLHDTTGRPSTSSRRSALLAPMSTATAQRNMVVAPHHPRRMSRGCDEGLDVAPCISNRAAGALLHLV